MGGMKSRSDWKIILALSSTVFAASMWYGISHGYDDIWLYAIAMALASWCVSAWGVFTVRKWQEWRGENNS
jgi:hypothetical protein